MWIEYWLLSIGSINRVWTTNWMECLNYSLQNHKKYTKQYTVSIAKLNMYCSIVFLSTIYIRICKQRAKNLKEKKNLLWQVFVYSILILTENMKSIRKIKKYWHCYHCNRIEIYKWLPCFRECIECITLRFERKMIMAGTIFEIMHGLGEEK